MSDKSERERNTLQTFKGPAVWTFHMTYSKNQRMQRKHRENSLTHGLGGKKGQMVNDLWPFSWGEASTIAKREDIKTFKLRDEIICIF
jgi:hypothetical protein